MTRDTVDVTPWEKEIQDFLDFAEKLEGRPLTPPEASLWLNQAIQIGELGPVPTIN